MLPFGPVSIDSTASGRSRITIGPLSKPVRLAFRSKRRMIPSFTAPTSRSPPKPAPSPHDRQNVRPVRPTVDEKVYRGRIRGIGPLLFVLGQLSFGPHPKFPPRLILLSSSLHSGPLSDSQSRSVCGSKPKPNEFRIPNAQIRLPNGFLPGIEPSSLIRRILPRRFCDRSWEFDGCALSPITM